MRKYLFPDDSFLDAPVRITKYRDKWYGFHRERYRLENDESWVLQTEKKPASEDVECFIEYEFERHDRLDGTGFVDIIRSPVIEYRALHTSSLQQGDLPVFSKFLYAVLINDADLVSLKQGFVGGAEESVYQKALKELVKDPARSLNDCCNAIMLYHWMGPLPPPWSDFLSEALYCYRKEETKTLLPPVSLQPYKKYFWDTMYVFGLLEAARSEDFSPEETIAYITERKQTLMYDDSISFFNCY